MASDGLSNFENVRIEAIAAALPPRRVTNEAFEARFGEKFTRRFGKATGIHARYLADEQTTLDLCVAAAKKLVQEGQSFAQVGAVILVTQTPDYDLPASALLAQHRLGLPTSVAAFDVNLGCSGFTYGLWLAASLIAAGSVEQVLLLAGDTISRVVDPDHRSTAPIFGDAGTATLITRHEGAARWSFLTGSDGSGSHSIIMPGSAQRDANVDLEKLAGEVTDGKLVMDGASVFGFATTIVPDAITRLLRHIGQSPDEIDALYLHQANELILKTIGRKVGVEPGKVVINLDRYGNTSSASIPLAIVTDRPDGAHLSVMCGFGVGLSWSALVAELEPFPVFLVEEAA